MEKRRDGEQMLAPGKAHTKYHAYICWADKLLGLSGILIPMSSLSPVAFTVGQLPI